MNFRNLKLGVKLILAFVLIGTVPMAVLGYLDFRTLDGNSDQETINKLSAIMTIKKNQIESWLGERMGDAKVLSTFFDVQEALVKYDEAFEACDGDVDCAKYKKVDDQFHELLAGYEKEYGYYDLFLIHKDGEVVYSVEKEPDFGTNLVKGKFRDSGLAKAFEIAMDGKIGLTDFEAYEPSNGEAAAFVAAPVQVDGELYGVAAMQLPLGRINAIMQERSGMGESGETYLVGKDFLMRSDSRFEKESTVLKKKVQTVGSEEALAGKSDCKLIKDYRGIEVWSAYTKLNIAGLEWALLSEIDDAEAKAAVVKARNTLILLLAVIAAAVTGLGILFAGTIKKPILKVQAVLETVAQGDLTHFVEVDQKDEVGQMADALNRTITSLSEMVGNIINSSNNVSTGSAQIASGNQELSQRTQEQASALEETSSTIEQMTATVKQNAENARKANEIAGTAAEAARTGNAVVTKTVAAMTEVTESAEKIANIVGMVNEIAFQTNLLALNAAVEAARAGEQGKGFAVVAAEVRNLAGRSGNAAKEIQTLINDSNNKIKDANSFVEESGNTLEKIITAVGNVAETVSEIAAASQEQASGIEQVNRAVMQMDQVVQQNASLVEEASSAAENLAGEAEEMNQLMAAFKVDSHRMTGPKHKHLPSIKPGNGQKKPQPADGKTHATIPVHTPVVEDFFEGQDQANIY